MKKLESWSYGPSEGQDSLPGRLFLLWGICSLWVSYI